MKVKAYWDWSAKSVLAGSYMAEEYLLRVVFSALCNVHRRWRLKGLHMWMILQLHSLHIFLKQFVTVFDLREFRIFEIPLRSWKSPDLNSLMSWFRSMLTKAGLSVFFFIYQKVFWDSFTLMLYASDRQDYVKDRRINGFGLRNS